MLQFNQHIWCLDIFFVPSANYFVALAVYDSMCPCVSRPCPVSLLFLLVSFLHFCRVSKDDSRLNYISFLFQEEQLPSLEGVT